MAIELSVPEQLEALYAEREALDQLIKALEHEWNERDCECSYAERHGTRQYRSCMGDKCRNEDHAPLCAASTCTACCGSDDETSQ